MNALRKMLPELLFTAALALTAGLVAYSLFDAAFIDAFGETNFYPRRFPAEMIAASLSMLASVLFVQSIFRRRKGRGAALFIAAGLLLAFPAMYLWELAFSLL